MKKSGFYLSIVTASRNDKRVNDFGKRERLFVDTIIKQADLFRMPLEIVLVEWNPPVKEVGLKSILRNLSKSEYCSLRIIKVPGEIHRKFPNQQSLGMFQFIAKNVGIRRAKGKFILSTSADIIFSNDLLEYISQKRLEEDLSYRAVRFDVPEAIKEKRELSERIKFCEEKAFRAFWPWGTDKIRIPISKSKLLFIKFRFKKFFDKKILFTNAAGDFNLFGRNTWNILQGYPEYATHGAKVDGLLCYSAHVSGIKEIIFTPPKSIYHLDHPGSYFSTSSKDPEAELKEKGVPIISRKEYWLLVDKMLETKMPLKYNDSRWGMADIKFKEYKLF